MEKKMVTKLEATKATVKAAEEKAVADVKETVKKVVEEKKAPVAEEKKAVVSAPAAEEKKTVESAPAAEEKKAVEQKKRGRKPGSKNVKKVVKEEMKPEVFIQFQGNEAVVEEAVEKAKAQFVAEGHRVSSIKSLQLYLKPEEFAAYYVINQKFAGKVDLF